MKSRLALVAFDPAWSACVPKYHREKSAKQKRGHAERTAKLNRLGKIIRSATLGTGNFW
jgi:hypothetical protein